MDADYNTAHSLSILILQTLCHETQGEAAIACALTIARLRNPKSGKLPVEREVAFVQDVLDWADTYLAVDPAQLSN